MWTANYREYMGKNSDESAIPTWEHKIFTCMWVFKPVNDFVFGKLSSNSPKKFQIRKVVMSRWELKL